MKLAKIRDIGNLMEVGGSVYFSFGISRENDVLLGGESIEKTLIEN